MKTNRWIIFAIMALWLGFGPAAWSQDEPPAEASSAPSPAAIAATPAKAVSLEIEVDTTKAPEMAEWAARAKELAIKNYPMILEHLGAEGFEPPTKVKLIFNNEKGIAGTAGTTIICAAGWFKAHNDDYGAVIHELCHVAQAYGRKRVPGWVTEGIADYVRWFNYEPADHRPRVNPQRAKYTDGYQTTAAFFDWIVRTKDKSFVWRLNDAARRGDYKKELFQEYTGQPLDELWAEFIESLKNK